MIKLTQANTGKDVWVNPAFVVVVESHPVTRIPNGERDETRIVMSNGGWVQVVGDPATVLHALGWGRAGMTSRLIVHIEGIEEGGRDDGSRDVYWDLPNENVTAVLLQNLLVALGPATESCPVDDPTAKFRVQRNGQDTSWEAALAQTPERRAELMRVIYAKLTEAPATDEELVELVTVDLPHQAPSGVRSRRNELVLTGWVTKARTRSGGVRKRRGDHGLPMIVWQAVPPGGDVDVPAPKRKPPYDEPDLRAKLTHAIVESMQDRDGCGSDLETVGDALEDDTWLFVSGALDVHHLVSDVLTVLDKELTRA